MTRQQIVAQSIVQSIQTPDEDQFRSSKLQHLVRRLFVLQRLRLIRYQHDLFQRLRRQWHVAESEYHASFKDEADLQSQGDMGFSGSTFFTTRDGYYIVKSVPRRFEHSFFRDDLLQPYASHMFTHVDSLLIRITDFLAADSPSIGGLLGLVPTHHIVMENLLFGQASQQESAHGQWETWDLKPDSYFFPERDIAGGRLTSEATKSKLVDRFDDKIVLSQSQADRFLALLGSDTQLLEEANAVDYSLFLVRIPLSKNNPFDDQADSTSERVQRISHPPSDTPLVPPSPPTWRTGVTSQDGKHVFRAAILDFFWAKHTTHAKAMTLLIKFWNIFGKHGPMSITTTPQEYRNRFLHMCSAIIEVRDDR